MSTAPRLAKAISAVTTPSPMTSPNEHAGTSLAGTSLYGPWEQGLWPAAWQPTFYGTPPLGIATAPGSEAMGTPTGRFSSVSVSFCLFIVGLWLPTSYGTLPPGTPTAQGSEALGTPTGRFSSFCQFPAQFCCSQVGIPSKSDIHPSIPAHRQLPTFPRFPLTFPSLTIMTPSFPHYFSPWLLHLITFSLPAPPPLPPSLPSLPLTLLQVVHPITNGTQAACTAPPQPHTAPPHGPAWARMGFMLTQPPSPCTGCSGRPTMRLLGTAPLLNSYN